MYLYLIISCNSNYINLISNCLISNLYLPLCIFPRDWGDSSTASDEPGWPAHQHSLSWWFPLRNTCKYIVPVFCPLCNTDALQKCAHLPMIFLPSFLTCSYSSLSSSERVTCCTNTLRSGNCTSMRPATLLFLVRLSVMPFTSACKFLKTHLQYTVEKFNALKGCGLGRSCC